MHLQFPSRFSLSEETLLTNVICGILSGVISSTIANPTDVLKVAIFSREACFCCFLLGRCSLLALSSRAGLAGRGDYYVGLLPCLNGPQKGPQARSD